jgi:hypothetical protein
MKKFDLSTIEPKALCNDGSGAVMYINENSKTKWHFHMDGGFFCYDIPTCLSRAQKSTMTASSKGYEDMKNNSGMFDPHLGGFSDYTHGQIPYCTSDAWMGMIEAEELEMVGGTTLSNGKPGTYFYGYYVTQGILKKFIDMGMGATPGQELWVSGCSAGSIAATAMADSWGPRLKALGIKNEVVIWTMLDNMPIVSPPAALPGTKDILSMAVLLVGFLYGPERGVSPPFLSKECVAHYTPAVENCVWPGEAIKWIKIPNIVLVQLWDNFVTAKTYGFMHPVKSMQYKTGVQVVEMTKDVFKGITPNQNFWSISCGGHCMSHMPEWWRLIPITGTQKSAKDLTLQTRDAALSKDSSKLGEVVTDKCVDYNCGCLGQGRAIDKLAFSALCYEVLTPFGYKCGGMKEFDPQYHEFMDKGITIMLTTSKAAGQEVGTTWIVP